MPVKIGFQVISCSGEDDNFRASELNYHGPTVRGWRSSANSSYPQEIILQLKVFAILHQIQILTHQYLIPQKIEICTSDRPDHDFLAQDSPGIFEYVGFITFSDNKATGFRSRELKSVLIPSRKAKYIKLVIHSNHVNVKNLHNQVSLIAVNVLGDELLQKTKETELNNNICCHSTSPTPPVNSCNAHYTSPYDDLAFEMYTDEEIVKIMKIVEAKKLQAVHEERFDQANALKITLENLKAAGQILGLYEQEKKHAIKFEDYDKAKAKKLQIENFREKVYNALRIDQLLQENDVSEGEDEDDENSNAEVNSTMSSHHRSPSRFSSYREDRIRDRSLPSKMYDNVNSSDYEASLYSCNSLRIPLPSPWKTHRSQNRSPSHLMHSKSQISFSDDPVYSTPAVVTSISNPQINRYLQGTNSNFPDGYIKANGYSKRIHRPPSEQDSLHYDKSLDDREEVLDRIRTPSSVSNSSGPDDLSQSYEKLSLPIETVHKSPSKSERNARVRGENLQRSESLRTSSLVNFNMSNSLRDDLPESNNKLKTSASEHFKNNLQSKSIVASMTKSSFEAYEDKLLPALRSYNPNEIVRECQLAFEQPRKSTLNERERKQATLPISIFGIEMIEKFYSKSFNDKEDGLKQLQQELKRLANPSEENTEAKQHSFNKIARAAIFLLHRALRDKVYSVYSSAAETVRLFFTEFVPQRVSSAEVARSVEKLLPELLTKSGDPTPRIHNMAAHTLLSMTECEEVRRLNIIQTHLSRPLTSSVHPRLALSRLEMVEQLILNHGISKDKRSGLTCRTLAEFGSSGLHHPAEPVRKVSERILIHVYKVNPRIVRKQLPPDDHVTRRNLLYRQLFQEFDFMDMQRKLSEQQTDDSMSISTNKIMNKTLSSASCESQSTKTLDQSLNGGEYSLTCIREEINKSSTNPSALKTVREPFFINRGDKSGKLGQKMTNGIAPHNLEKLKSVMFGNKTQLNGSRNTERSENSRTKGTSLSSKGKKVTMEADLTLANAENGNETLKFPSLVDSICTTKARLMMDQTKSTKLKAPDYGISKDQSFYPTVNKGQKITNGILKMETKRDMSSIPLPTFGTNRKAIINPQRKSHDQQKHELLAKIPNDKTKKSESLNKSLRTKGFESTDDPKLTDIKKEVLENLEKKSKIPLGASNSFSEKKVIQRVNGKTQMPNTIKASNVETECQSNLVLINEEKTMSALKSCIFCLSTKWSTEESLNNHYLTDCPMLTTCRYCMEMIEIPGYINHLLGDCSEKHLFQKCDNCQEAILKDLFPCHECKASSGEIHKSRCPFCHNDIKEGETSWRSHLMGTDVCPNHPRQKQISLPL